jgi:hypothetical protein
VLGETVAAADASDHGRDTSVGTVMAWGAGALVVALSVGLGLWGFALQSVGRWTPGGGLGGVAGWIAVSAMVGLVGHAVPKRMVGLWMRRRRRGARATGPRASTAPVRSRLRPFVRLHVTLGWVALAAAVAHAGPRLSTNAAGSLYAVWLGVCLLGLVGAAAYRVLPPALSRIERDGALPEDLGSHRAMLVDRLYRDLHGRSDLLKTITQRVLLPYARAPGGWLRLLAARRSLAAERARLRRRIDAMLQGRGESKLAGIDALIRTAVELRALWARRVVTAVLRGWLVPHIVLVAAAVVLLGVHVIAMGGRP